MERREAIRLSKQSDMILSYLKAYGTITPSEAMLHLGCMRLAARIHDLKQQGHRITSERALVENRDGDACKVARYRLEQEPAAVPVQGSMF